MNKVKIIVDSCADLTKELYAKYDIDIVRSKVLLEGKTFIDGVNLTLEELYASVKKTGQLPHTSAPSPVEFEEMFKKYIDDGCDIVYVGLGDKLSTTFQSAFIAKQNFPEDRIYLVNTKTLSSAIGLVAIKAAELAKEGVSAKEIAEKCDACVPNVTAQFAVETLDYLHKGGRCSGAAMLVGHILHIHPYIKVVDGSLIVYKKVRGPMRIAINEQINELKLVKGKLDLGYVMITHAGCDDDVVAYAKSEVAKLVPEDKILITRAGSVIASHCGYGTIGILYITK